MKGLTRILWLLYQCFACYTLLIYTLILLVPFGGWLAGFMMMSFPIVVFIHLVSVPVWFVVERKKAILPLIMVGAACFFLPRTYAFNSTAENVTAAEGAKEFSVMNYNVHVFQRNSGAWKSEVKREIRKMKSWIIDSQADVICMPEYFNDDELKGVLDTRNYFSANGYQYNALHSQKKQGKRKGYWGLAVFSKYPIVAVRDTVFEEQNGMIQTDIKVGEDTVRVLALHLYSMTLQLGALVAQKEMDGIKREGRITFGKMKNGFTRRAAEYEIVQSWVDQSPYPLIVCGDFNEVPYGYVYGKLRKHLRNSFEEKGRGFGFTYNQIPYFIRIDHQFYDDSRLSLHAFRTFSKVPYSDHNPIMGTYTVK
ncbi:endonuclease/exonuclease/phosphatase family protein [Dyadobacter fermentans]|uniref:Endonuclease/exonuclease/phosphatase n=1 Tax=Dyadobacter fermentans (strain ATCC 700827 / DSM 18053 / CIP 107007 / KCTC 52180 / NS114) TaxID=471854 RepID=C6VUJ8_DYAFD|nr:endonuclease/exonuclease/phosphatase family protein [Dyadobacter fermentans]ACT91307.1 Endonuclease/exonuclease/phosphatase [Dyadobacter fermentans DSM 18053]